MTEHLVLAHAGHYLGLLFPAGMLVFAYFLMRGTGRPRDRAATEKRGQARGSRGE